MEVYNNGKTWLASSLAIILTIICAILMFFISSVEGTKEIRASNGDSVKILEIWRTENNMPDGFPEEKAITVEYENHEYYFVGDEAEWYFAYDGGIDYIFGDYKFYVLTAISFIFSIIIAQTNYTSAITKAMKSDEFIKTQAYYKSKKDQIEQYTQYIPEFCLMKNKQAYEDAKRDIVESADISWQYFNSSDFDYKKLERWQKIRLRKIKKIKIVRMRASDLLQESIKVNHKISMLPQSQAEHESHFLTSGLFKKLLSSVMSGFVIGFGVVLGNWTVGATYAVVLLSGAISATIVATDFANTTLRNRYIAKANYLIEFNNIKQQYVDKI